MRARLVAINGSARAAELYLQGHLDDQPLLDLQARSANPILTYSDGSLEVKTFFKKPPIPAHLNSESFRSLSEAPRSMRLSDLSREEGRLAGSSRPSEVWAVSRDES